ncbi:hypothetical protein COB64_04665 [Candidatus Wolfebacteria bacterium]|nr:MAG: hypothetical protein COB64_04665 [Candidatus Wolfebacteria bacterium]
MKAKSFFLMLLFIVTVPVLAQKPQVQTVPFSEFHPTAHAKYTGEDTLLKYSLTFIADNPMIDSILVYYKDSLAVRNDYIISLYEGLDTVTNLMKTRNPSVFTDSVFSTALYLGYSKEMIKTLEIHDLILLAGKITSERMTYDSTYSTESHLMKYIDDIFHEGIGVCTQFAFVNSSVFSVIKGINNNADGTYMKTMAIGDHALNEVISLIDTLNRKQFLLAYVDPTRLTNFMQELGLNDMGKLILRMSVVDPKSLTADDYEFAIYFHNIEDSIYSKIDPHLVTMLKKHSALVFSE